MAVKKEFNIEKFADKVMEKFDNIDKRFEEPISLRKSDGEVR